MGNEDNSDTIKVIDFGYGKILKGDDHDMKAFVGTAFYIAPEVLYGKYNEKCDIWSTGVITYKILTGLFPFYANN
jgi:calcium-dependent protein kinase